MPVLRRQRYKIPAQKAARRQFDIARRFVDVLTMGIGDQLKNVYDEEELDIVLVFIERELRPAIRKMEATDIELAATLRKPSKKGPKVA